MLSISIFYGRRYYTDRSALPWPISERDLWYAALAVALCDPAAAAISVETILSLYSILHRSDLEPDRLLVFFLESGLLQMRPVRCSSRHAHTLPANVYSFWQIFFIKRIVH